MEDLDTRERERERERDRRVKERDRRDKLEERRKEKRVTEANEVRIKFSLETKVVDFKLAKSHF